MAAWRCAATRGGSDGGPFPQGRMAWLGRGLGCTLQAVAAAAAAWDDLRERHKGLVPPDL
eukprot:361481-Chlamydomonas_euryale.AAC.3